MEESIQSRFLNIKERISQSCHSAGRMTDDVSLVVVTKGRTAEEIMEVVKAGAVILGENYPEETIEKIQLIDKRVNPVWHMIGHLQSRKIKLMYPYFKMIHSVDSIELAKKLDTFYKVNDEKCSILLELNIAGEETKFGFSASSTRNKNELLGTIEELLSFENLRLNGLMTMPPYAIQKRQNATYYDQCRQMMELIQKKFSLKEFNQISMGTSADFETAIECGATIIRVGEAIMGKRIEK